jgi:RND family efflux transporter MFP subunit
VTGILTEVLFREGEIVESGALLAKIDDRMISAALAQAEAEKAGKEAQLKVAQLDRARYGGLVEEHVIPRQTMDKQSALVEELQAGIRASEAAIAAQRVYLSFTRIVSPVRGRVGIRRVDPGNLVQAGDSNGLTTVTQIDPISVLFTLPQESMARVFSAMHASGALGATAFDRDAGVELARGHITTFDNQVDAASGTLRLRAEFANPGGKLWPGQFVALQLQTSVSANALVLPARALQQGLNGAYVFRIRDSKAEVVPVAPVWQDDEIAVVDSGVEVGEQVVVDGQSRLKSGAKVNIRSVSGESVVGGT